MLQTRRSKLTAVLVGVSALTVGIAHPAVAAPQEAPRHLLFNTTLTYDDGSAAAGATVTVSAYPSDMTADVLQTTRVFTGTADAQGHVSVTTAADLASFAHADGTVSFDVAAGDTVNSLDYDLDLPYSTIAAAPQIRAAQTRTAHAQSVKMSFAKGSAALHRGRSRFVVAASASQPGVSGHNCVNGYGDVWVRNTSSHKNVNSDIIKLMTKSNTTATYDWNSSSTTELGVDYEYEGSDGLVTASAGQQKTVETQAGTTLKAGNNKTEYGELTFEYEQYHKYCVGSQSYNSDLEDAHAWQWRPYVWSEGSDYESAPAAFTCNTAAGRRVKIGGASWVSRSATNSISGALSIDGLSLSAKQTNGSSSKLTFTPDGSSAYLCGSNGVPSVASQTEED